MLNLVSRLGPISIAQRDDDSVSEAGNVCLALKQDQPADRYALQRCDELQRRKKNVAGHWQNVRSYNKQMKYTCCSLTGHV